MTTAIEISELGMINDMRQLDVISHNLANANTAGFKRDMAVTRSFEQVLSDSLAPLANRFDLTPEQLVPAMTLQVDHAPGAFRQTGNPLDLAIEGQGFFELRGSEGVRYSRLGSFSIDAQGRLVNSQNLTVVGVDGDILLQGGDITIDRDGVVHEDGVYAGQLKLVSFADPTQLAKVGHGMWQSGEGQSSQVTSDVGVRQGYQETSNVQVMEEMVQMMTTLRHFETTSRVIKGYDEMVSTAISTIAEF